MLQLGMHFDYLTSDWAILDGEHYGRCWNASFTMEESAARHIGELGQGGTTIKPPGLIKFTIDKPPFEVMWVSPARLTLVKRGKMSA